MKIVIIKLSALGDLVQAMVVLQFIKKINKKIIIDWVVEDCYKDLLMSHPDINKLHTLKLKKAKKNKSLKQAYRELKKVKNIGDYDIAIDMQGLLKSAIVTSFIQAKLKVGFDKNSTRESIAAIFYNKKLSINYSENIIVRNFSLVMHALDEKIESKKLYDKVPFLFSSNQFKLDDLLSNKKNILLIVGASFESKCYPPEKLIEIIKSIDANYFVVWGNENENLIAQKIKSKVNSLNVLNKMSLNQLISVVNQMDLVIGPDTGPTHIAWGLNIPSITLFGPTSAYRNCLISNKNHAIESETEVNPFKINKNDFSIKNILVADIVKKSNKLLEVTL